MTLHFSQQSLVLRYLNEDLLKITQWAHRWRMSFNPDIAKQAQQFFSQKKNDASHPGL